MMKHSFKHSGPGFVFFALFMLAALPAHAQSISDLFLNLYLNTPLIPTTIELVAYILGLYALYSGLTALKETSQEPGKKPIRPAVIRFIVAAALIAFPRTILVIVRSMNNTELEAMQPLPTTKLMNGIK